jgi:hypothetical protein
MMEFKRFNDVGIAAFREWLGRLRADSSLQPPFAMLDEPGMTEPIEPVISATPKAFQNRMQFAQWLHAAATTANAKVPLRDAGFWSWLTLLLFDQVCPPDNGSRTVRKDPTYIPDPDYRRAYRHLLSTAYRIYYLHRDDPSRVRFLLDMQLSVFGELTEQFASRQELIGTPGIMSLANRLFADPDTGELKKGAGGEAAGRFGKLLNQYMRTWDIAIMKPENSARLLPAEFDRFRTTG